MKIKFLKTFSILTWLLAGCITNPPSLDISLDEEENKSVVLFHITPRVKIALGQLECVDGKLRDSGALPIHAIPKDGWVALEVSSDSRRWYIKGFDTALGFYGSTVGKNHVGYKQLKSITVKPEKGSVHYLGHLYLVWNRDEGNYHPLSNVEKGSYLLKNISQLNEAKKFIKENYKKLPEPVESGVLVFDDNGATCD